MTTTMAHALFVTPSYFYPHSSIPASPDPTPLRMLAFSVAEAALQSNPNSPALNIHPPSVHVPSVDSWTPSRGDPCPQRTAPAGGSKLWDVVERAKERRVKAVVKSLVATCPNPHDNAQLPLVASPAPPPVSRSPSPPAAVDYNFVLPPHSPLASSVAAYQARQLSPVRQTSQTPPPFQPFPLYTRSAEPSPTKNAFTVHDQNCRSPELRLAACEFASKQVAARVQRRSETHPSPSRHISRLPSLAQIQAKLQHAGHRRSGSVGTYSPTQMPQIERTLSNDSMDIPQTPRGDSPAARPRIVNADSPDRSPPTPPSPTTLKDDRLTSFLRQRTSGRLAEAKMRPVTVAPRTEGIVMSFPGSGPQGPVYTVTPPTLTSPSVPRPSLVLSTPPSLCSPLGSPTDSLTVSSTSSPTLSVPIITCTPAPSRSVCNGVEQDSDEDETDFVLFGAETDPEDDRDERERRSKEMLDRLMLRRQSD